MEINDASFKEMNIPTRVVTTKDSASTRVQAENIQKKQEVGTIDAVKKANETPLVSEDKNKVREELIRLSSQLNNQINPLSTNIKFAFSEDIRGLFVNVIDSKTDKVIRTFPSEEAIELATKMKELVGMIFDKKI